MNVVLWIFQGLLAAAFAMAGLNKLFSSPDALIEAGMAWVAAVPPWIPKVAGAAEVLGAIGLVLPAALRIKPVLTPLAAIGLATVMVLAAGLHASLGEWGMVPVNAVLGGLAAFVAWGRLKARPIALRGAAPSPA